MAGMLIAVIGAVVLGALTDSGFRDLGHAVLVMFAPAIITFIVARRALENWLQEDSGRSFDAFG